MTSSPTRFALDAAAPVAHPVTSADTGQLVDLLLAAGRTRPIVFVSVRNIDDGPCVDADRLAARLAGTAHVLVAVDRFPSVQLLRYLPPALGCEDGAVRVYRPAMSAADDPARHPRWTAAAITALDPAASAVDFRTSPDFRWKVAALRP